MTMKNFPLKFMVYLGLVVFMGLIAITQNCFLYFGVALLYLALMSTYFLPRP